MTLTFADRLNAQVARSSPRVHSTCLSSSSRLPFLPSDDGFASRDRAILASEKARGSWCVLYSSWSRAPLTTHYRQISVLASQLGSVFYSVSPCPALTPSLQSIVGCHGVHRGPSIPSKFKDESLICTVTDIRQRLDHILLGGNLRLQQPQQLRNRSNILDLYPGNQAGSHHQHCSYFRHRLSPHGCACQPSCGYGSWHGTERLCMLSLRSLTALHLIANKLAVQLSSHTLLSATTEMDLYHTGKPFLPSSWKGVCQTCQRSPNVDDQLLFRSWIFFILSLLGLRQWLARIMPQSLVLAVGAGIGIYIACVLLKICSVSAILICANFFI